MKLPSSEQHLPTAINHWTSSSMLEVRLPRPVNEFMTVKDLMG